MEGTNGIGLGDAMLLANQGKDGWGNGGCFFWIIILFWLMSGNNGWGNNKGYATQQDVYAAADNQQLDNSIRDVARQINQVGDGISSATFALNNTVNNGFTGAMRDNFTLQQSMMGGMANISQAISENRFANQQCCCETNRNIDSVRYDNALNTTNINTTATANTQKILDKLCMMENNAKDAEIASLRQQLSNANLAVSQQAQNAQLISAIRPFPVPAYPVSSPYAANCGCGV